MDYRKEVMRRQKMEHSNNLRVILVLSALLFVVILIVGAIMLKMLYHHNTTLHRENVALQSEIDDISAQNTKLQEDSSYIFPDSDTRYLEEADIKDLSTEKIELGKYEIYARHGRKFYTQSYQDYFESQDWYKGTVEPENVSEVEAEFNEYEKANVKFLNRYLKNP